MLCVFHSENKTLSAIDLQLDPLYNDLKILANYFSSLSSWKDGLNNCSASCEDAEKGSLLSTVFSKDKGLSWASAQDCLHFCGT